MSALPLVPNSIEVDHPTITKEALQNAIKTNPGTNSVTFENAESMELEHMIGISTHFKQCFVIHPIEENKYIHALGNILVISDFNDAHNQAFLRGHDMPISSITISLNGDYIATGQYGSPNMKNTSVVNLWDYKNQQLLHTFEGVNNEVNKMLFTSDNKFLMVCDVTGLFVVWDIYSFETITAKRVNLTNVSSSISSNIASKNDTMLANTTIKTITSNNLSKGSISTNFINQHQSSINPNNSCFINDFQILLIEKNNPNYSNSTHNIYHIILTYNHKIYEWKLIYSVQHMEYIINNIICYKYPTNKTYKRNLTSLSLNNNKTTVLATTDAGEIFLFNSQHKVFIDSFQACSQGASVALFTDDDNIIAGGGDGCIRLFTYNEYQKQWFNKSKIELNNSITMLQHNLNKQINKLIYYCATNVSQIYTLNFTNDNNNNINKQILIEGHCSCIKSIAFGTHNHIFATITNNGLLSLWDLSNYNVILQVNNNNIGTSSIIFVDNNNILIGLNNGNIICWNINIKTKEIKLLWKMINCHRGKVTAISLHGQYNKNNQILLTGGEDGIFRLWNYNNRTIMGQFHLLIGKIISIICDNEKNYLIHILGNEKQLITFNMKKDNIITRRMIKSKYIDYTMTSMSLQQSNICEKEIFCVTNNGQIIIWDPQLNDMIINIDLKILQSMYLKYTNNNNNNISYNLTCCSLSHNSKYLSIGNTIGQIIILDVSNYSNNNNNQININSSINQISPAMSTQSFNFKPITNTNKSINYNKNNNNSLNQQPNVEIIGDYQYHGASITDCAWTPDDKQIISTAKDGSVCVWNFYL